MCTKSQPSKTVENQAAVTLEWLLEHYERHLTVGELNLSNFIIPLQLLSRHFHVNVEQWTSRSTGVRYRNT